MKLIKRILGHCPHCERYFKYPKKRMMNTCYEDYESNFVYECMECYERTLEYYQELWDDYNSSR